jgi:hypothetical protein
MNGTSPNGNRRPECRLQICAKRRKVRHVAEEDEGDEDAEGGELDEDIENDLLDNMEEDFGYDESAQDSDDDAGEIFVVEL